nr:odorant receptor 57 [Papilio memnon]
MLLNPFKKRREKSTLNIDTITNYTHFLELPLKIVACWDWYREPKCEREVIINYLYLALVLFSLTSLTAALFAHLLTEWQGVMDSLDDLADGLPLLASLAIVSYFALRKRQLYDLTDFINSRFRCHSARGLTNMTMLRSYCAARDFAYFYTACTLFSVAMYVMSPVIAHLWTKQPLQGWIYMDATTTAGIVCAFLKQCVGQAFVGLAVGQLGVVFAAHAVLVCGQLELACCGLRNARCSALLAAGVRHAALAASHLHAHMLDDERHTYCYNISEIKESRYHYDQPVAHFRGHKTEFVRDIYSGEYEAGTCGALAECARALQTAGECRARFQALASPLLALRVVQVTLYLCTLLYAAREAERVRGAAYGSGWGAMGARARRLVLAVLQASGRGAALRAGGFLPMDLHTFLVIIKTSFSYYTLLVNVNEK